MTYLACDQCVGIAVRHSISSILRGGSLVVTSNTVELESNTTQQQPSGVKWAAAIALMSVNAVSSPLRVDVTSSVIFSSNLGVLLLARANYSVYGALPFVGLQTVAVSGISAVMLLDNTFVLQGDSAFLSEAGGLYVNITITVLNASTVAFAGNTIMVRVTHSQTLVGLSMRLYRVEDFSRVALVDNFVNLSLSSSVSSNASGVVLFSPTEVGFLLSASCRLFIEQNQVIVVGSTVVRGLHCVFSSATSTSASLTVAGGTVLSLSLNTVTLFAASSGALLHGILLEATHRAGVAAAVIGSSLLLVDDNTVTLNASSSGRVACGICLYFNATHLTGVTVPAFHLCLAQLQSDALDGSGALFCAEGVASVPKNTVSHVHQPFRCLQNYTFLAAMWTSSA